LLVGDPNAANDPEWDFPPLPGARREVEEIADWLASDPQSGPARRVLTGERATKEAVLAAISEKPQLIYLAAHGIAEAEEPLDGFIALSGGRLSAREVQSTLTDASMVVLSACQTGLGRAHPGGVIGLARGFQLGGAATVVMSLWNVDDEATRLLMTEFMKRVGHASPSEALRQAMLALRRTHTDPMLWGSFQSFGSLLPARR
jgi:CHAT domain-containing protein